MHRLSIVFACAAIVFASQASLARDDHDVHFSLARANTSLDQFRQDREDCKVKAVRGGHHGPPPQTFTKIWPNYSIHPDDDSNTNPGNDYEYLGAKFLRCMLAKGYEKATWSTGFHTGRLW
jgi:hypothetical protein